MKEKLDNLQISLADKLDKARKASEWTMQPLVGGVSGKSGHGRTDPDDEDARSDLSALAEDVIDAIENPHLSDSDAEETQGGAVPDDLEGEGMDSVGPIAAAMKGAAVAEAGLRMSGRAIASLGYSSHPDLIII